MGERYSKSIRLLAERLQGFERLEQKGLVLRERSLEDKRSYFVRLTDSGDAVFRDVFPKVVAHCKQLFAGFSDAEFDEVDGALRKLRERILGAARPSS